MRKMKSSFRKLYINHTEEISIDQKNVFLLFKFFFTLNAIST